MATNTSLRESLIIAELGVVRQAAKRARNAAERQICVERERELEDELERITEPAAV